LFVYIIYINDARSNK